MDTRDFERRTYPPWSDNDRKQPLRLHRTDRLHTERPQYSGCMRMDRLLEVVSVKADFVPATLMELTLVNNILHSQELDSTAWFRQRARGQSSARSRPFTDALTSLGGSSAYSPMDDFVDDVLDDPWRAKCRSREQRVKSAQESLFSPSALQSQ